MEDLFLAEDNPCMLLSPLCGIFILGIQLRKHKDLKKLELERFNLLSELIQSKGTHGYFPQKTNSWTSMTVVLLSSNLLLLAEPDITIALFVL